jgi:hypothetical protein
MDQNEIQKVVLIVLKYRVNSLLPIAQKPQPIRAINPYFTCSTEHYSKLHDEVKTAEKILRRGKCAQLWLFYKISCFLSKVFILTNMKINL